MTLGCFELYLCESYSTAQHRQLSFEGYPGLLQRRVVSTGANGVAGGLHGLGSSRRLT